MRLFLSDQADWIQEGVQDRLLKTLDLGTALHEQMGSRESHVLRLLWMGVLIAIPVLAAGLHHHVGHGHVAGIRDYIARANEAFVGLLIIHAYFGYWMRSALATNRQAA